MVEAQPRGQLMHNAQRRPAGAPVHAKPTKLKSDATWFESHTDASAFAALHCKGWPAWRVELYGELHVIAYVPEGPWLQVRS